MQMQTREQGVWWVGSAAFGATAAHDTAKRARSRDDGMRVFADTYQRRYDPPFAAGSAPPTPFLRAAAFPMIRVGRIKAHETGFAALPPRGRPWSGGGDQLVGRGAGALTSPMRQHSSSAAVTARQMSSAASPISKPQRSIISTDRICASGPAAPHPGNSRSASARKTPLRQTRQGPEALDGSRRGRKGK